MGCARGGTVRDRIELLRGEAERMDLGELVVRAAVAVLAIGLGFSVRRWVFPDERRTSSRSSKVWRGLTDELGLDWHTDGDRASGWIGDDQVLIAAVDHRTHVSFALWPPLDFGLDAIASDAPVPSMTEYPDWLTARCGERERLRKFFTPTLRAVLADTPSLRDLGARVVLGDERFSVVCEDVVLPEQLRFLVKAAIDTANAIRAARPDVPVSYRLSPLVHEWDTIVRSRGFVRERTPVGLRRDLGNMHLRCFVRYRRRKRFVVASAEFTKRQRIGILASSGKFANSPIPWSMRDWSTSDLAFDAVFSVSALSQEHVERWLPDGVRRMLCEVARTWRDVVFDDYGVSIEVSLDDDEFPIEPLMDDAQRIVEELQASMPPSRQAYR